MERVDAAKGGNTAPLYVVDLQNCVLHAGQTLSFDEKVSRNNCESRFAELSSLVSLAAFNCGELDRKLPRRLPVNNPFILGELDRKLPRIGLVPACAGGCCCNCAGASHSSTCALAAKFPLYSGIDWRSCCRCCCDKLLPVEFWRLKLRAMLFI